MAIMVFVRQQFPVRRKRGDRNGFSFVEPTIREAMAELARWHAADLEIAGSSSFVQAEFFDHDQFRANPLNTKPFRIVTSIPRAPTGAVAERLVTDDRLVSPRETLEAAIFTRLS
jgi:hypothetical protein